MKEKFTISRRPDLRKYLSYEAQEIENAYAGQPPLAGIWVIEKISPGHSILLHDKSVANSERILDENNLRLIREIFFQFESGEQNLERLKRGIVALNVSFERLKQRIEEDLKKLVVVDAIASIQLTLVQNCIKEIEQLSSDLDDALKKGNEVIGRHQAAINKCYALFFASSTKVIDSTLTEQVLPISEAAQILKKDIAQFKEELSKKENILIQANLDRPVLNRVSLKFAEEYADVLHIIADLQEIEIFDPLKDKIQLHQDSDFANYVKNIILALKNQDSSDLLDKLTNYKQERLDAIRVLVDQLALSLALEEPLEKNYLLYRWIEICRGNSPQKRFFNKKLFDSKDLSSIHQDLVLKEIYFKLPRILKDDLTHEAEYRAQETNVIDSTRSIDDPNLNADQISLQWCRFITQERSRFERGERPRSLELMYCLYGDITDPRKEKPEDARWEQQLKIAYKIYNAERGVRSENRLLTQEPLTEEEYQLIQKDTSLSRIFSNLQPEIQQQLRLEHYKSILLQVLASHSSLEDAPINLQGLLKHDGEYKADYLLTNGEVEFARGFSFLIEGEYLQYKLKHAAVEKLEGILREKGFTHDEACSAIAFMREQMVYSIFSYFFSARGRDIKEHLYNIKELPQYINVYKENGTVYFEVKSSPWCFIRTDLDEPIIFPDQANPTKIDNFYNAEFTLRYELILGKNIENDVLRLLDVTTDVPASWQLSSFQSEEWKKLPKIKRYIKAIELIMVTLNDASPENQQQAKNTIAKWLNDETNPLILEDYKLIQKHLLSIAKVDLLSKAIGEEWLKANIERCTAKIELYSYESSAWNTKKTEILYVKKSDGTAFNAQVAFADLISNHPEKVSQAKHEIADFLSVSPSSLVECEQLHELLTSLLTSPLQIDRDELAIQINLCKIHIVDFLNVSIVVSKLMDVNTRLEGMERIHAFLNAATPSDSKCRDLAKKLTELKTLLQAKDSKDSDFVDWLNAAIESATGGSPESSDKLSSSSALIARRDPRKITSSYSSSDPHSSSLSGSLDLQASSSSSSLSRHRDPITTVSQFFATTFSRLSSKDTGDTPTPSGKRRQSPP